MAGDPIIEANLDHLFDVQMIASSYKALSRLAERPFGEDAAPSSYSRASVQVHINYAQSALIGVLCALKAAGDRDGERAVDRMWGEHKADE